METAETSSIKKFSDFNILFKRSFEGPKMYPEDLLNKEFTVHFSEIRPSTKKHGEEFLYLQITLDGTKRLLWSSSKYLIKAVKEIPESGFPFNTKIIKINQHFEFR